MSKRHTPKDRKGQLLVAALELAERVGYTQVTRDALAAAAGVSPALVSVRFGTMLCFRRDLMRFAIRKEALRVIAQGLCISDCHARKAPEELRRRAMDELARG